MDESAQGLTRDIKAITSGVTRPEHVELYLELITSYLKEHPHINKRFADLEVEKGEDGYLTKKTPDGLIINDLLPPDIIVVFAVERRGSSNTYGYDESDKAILIPTDFGQRGLEGRVWFSHEAGHLLNPEDEKLDKGAYDAQFDAYKHGSDSSPEGNRRYLKAVCSEVNNTLKREVGAWDYGKPLANLFGIDEITYEDVVHHQLLWYYFAEMQELEYGLRILGDDKVQEAEYVLYDPISRKERYFRHDELRTFLEELKPISKVLKAQRAVERIEETLKKAKNQ